jgi:hypothetical protein
MMFVDDFKTGDFIDPNESKTFLRLAEVMQ